MIQLREGGWKKASDAEMRAQTGKSMVPISAMRSRVVGGSEVVVLPAAARVVVVLMDGVCLGVWET